jgi:RNA recognition motif. (a.k.a. RRM, RBD, or RNP domain)
LTFFLQFGNVLDSVVMFDRETRKPRGFGFVTFDDPEVCRRLLRMGQMDTLDEETTSEAATAHSSGRLEMRGKLIEVKAAQPKAPGAVSSSSSSTQPKAQPYYTSSQHYPATSGPASDYASQSAKMLSHQAPEYHHNPGFGAKHPATLPHHHHHHHAKFPSALYGFSAPPTPGGAMFGADPSTPVTPQQAALDMAHHMMFYSQLLATPTLISPLISPMMSPMIMGFHDPNQFQQFSQHFQPYKAQQTMQQQQQQQQSPHSSPQPFYNSTNKSHMPPPTPATASKAPAVVTADKGLPSSTGTPFRIGGATFAFEEPESPTPEREEL